MRLERCFSTYLKHDFFAPQKPINEYRSKQIECYLKAIESLESDVGVIKNFESMQDFVMLFEKCIAYFGSATFEQADLIINHYKFYKYFTTILPSSNSISLHSVQWNNFKFKIGNEKARHIEGLELLANQIFGYNWNLKPFHEFTELIKQFTNIFKRIEDLAELDLLSQDDKYKLLDIFKRLPHTVISDFNISCLSEEQFDIFPI